jgi:hypothetical protein
MRELTMEEIAVVSGGHDSCGNNYGGVTDTSSIGNDLINFYEGLVAATSHIIERVANAI